MKLIRKRIDEIYLILLNEFENFDRIGIASGKAGVILFLFYYHRLSKGDRAYNIGFKLLEETIELINREYTSPTFINGVAGIGWLVEHLNKNDHIKCDTNILLDDLDYYLFKSAIDDLNNNNYDFLHGAIGKAIFLLSRKNCKDEFVSKIALHLYKYAIKDEKGGLKWSSYNRKLSKNVINLSLSHGLASIINFYTRLYKNNIQKELSEEIIYNSVNFLKQNEIIDEYYIFPNFIYKNMEVFPSRLAWCYGDLGIGSSLWFTADCIKNGKLKKYAERILQKTINRKDLLKNKVFDSSLCHGTSGIAHIYNRMYINSQKEIYKTIRDYWLKKVIEMTDNLNNFQTNQYKTGKFEFEKTFGFLEGIAGIGLALISAVSDIEPKWDEALLLS